MGCRRVKSKLYTDHNGRRRLRNIVRYSCFGRVPPLARAGRAEREECGRRGYRVAEYLLRRNDPRRDGGLTFQIVDIAVDPDHQGRGLGKTIVGRLVEHLRENAPAGAHISLLADGPAEHLYAKFGFRLTAPASVGMDLPLG